MSLFQDGHITIWGWMGKLVWGSVGTESLVQIDAIENTKEEIQQLIFAVSNLQKQF